MAESNLNVPTQSQWMFSNPPAPHTQGLQASASALSPPAFPSYGNSYTYETSGYHQFHANQYGPQMADPGQSNFHHHHARFLQYHPYASSANYRSGYYPPPADPFHHGLGGAATPAPYRNPQLPSSLHSDFTDSRHEANMPPMLEPPLPSNTQAYPLPAYSHILPPQMSGTPFTGRRAGPNMFMPGTTQANRFGADLMPPSNQGRGASRGVPAPTFENSRQPTSPQRRPSHERHFQHTSSTPNAPERRSQPFPIVHSRRSDRSVSPRTSHRRSFDRYSTDLSPSGANDAEEAVTRQRVLQRRRARERAFAFRHSQHMSDSGPSSSQMQALKDKLRHFLPGELPEGSSTCCDICQKDYSNKHCLPTEDEEVAIQLPCKHVFGEHCINTWFVTCKAHKNKITCPMCRTLLIEPLRSPAAVLSGMPEMMAFFSRLDRNGTGISPADQQLFSELVRARGLEGDT